KAAENIEAVDAGILRIAVGGPNPGDKVKVGQVVAHLVGEGETTPTVAIKPVAAAVPNLTPAAGPAARRLARQLGVDLARAPGSGAGGRITETDVRQYGAGIAAASTPTTKRAISPRARRAAKELEVNWETLTGSGRNGRIRERDVLAAAAASPGGRLIPHTRIRKIIAERMVAGVTHAAPVTLTTKVNAANLVNLRKQFKATASAQEAVPTYTDLIVKLAAASLAKHLML